MGRVYSGRNQVSGSAYRQAVLRLREGGEFSAAQLGVIAAYAKAQDNPTQAAQLRAGAGELAASLTASEKSAVNSLLSSIGAGGVD